MGKILSLSFELEKTTRAASMLANAFILFISTFILFLPIVLIPLITSESGSIHIYTVQVLFVLMFLVIFFLVISAILMLKISSSLTAAYEVKENTITRGFLSKVPSHLRTNTEIQSTTRFRFDAIF